MRRRIFVLSITTFLLTAWLGVAWSAQAIKVGYIDLQRIMENSHKGKEFREKVFQLRKEKEGILQSKQEELTRMRQDYQQKALTLSDRSRLDREQELRQREIELQNLSESYRQEVLMEGRKLQALMFKDLSEVVRQIGQQDGFTMIFDKDATLFVSESIDITERVIKEYNASSGVTSSPPPRKPSSKEKK